MDLSPRQRAVLKRISAGQVVRKTAGGFAVGDGAERIDVQPWTLGVLARNGLVKQTESGDYIAAYDRRAERRQENANG